LYFIETKRAAAQSQREQCRKKTAIIQKEDKTPMYKMQKIMPPIPLTVSAAKAKKGLTPSASCEGRQRPPNWKEKESKSQARKALSGPLPIFPLLQNPQFLPCAKFDVLYNFFFFFFSFS
jgi:hypothetical protein